jgi:hypothetical protein
VTVKVSIRTHTPRRQESRCRQNHFNAGSNLWLGMKGRAAGGNILIRFSLDKTYALFTLF